MVGVLLFAPLFFLLPTSLVYYILACSLHLSCAGVQAGLRLAVQLLLRNPAYTVCCWGARPGMLSGGPRGCFGIIPLSCSTSPALEQYAS